MVRRQLTQVNTASIETDLLSHILMDDSGQAARIFLAERDDLQLARPEAAILAAELVVWQEQGAGSSPRDFVIDRWNTAGDGIYRGFVSQLISKEDHPVSTDFTRVVQDCLGRLQANFTRQKMAAGHYSVRSSAEDSKSDESPTTES